MKVTGAAAAAARDRRIGTGMQLSSEAYYWLAGGLLGAVLVDLIATRLFLEAMRPASAYVFHAGRAGKLTAVAVWLAFLTGVWYPRFLVSEREAMPSWLTPAAFGVFVLAAAAAAASLPRASRRRGDA
jgi:uncharacterized membrane protein YbhN (UPF0104 family)